jgi:quinol monooxygenase YgiN
VVWGQHALIRAKPGLADRLLAKFVEAVEMQRGNPACLLMLVGPSTEDPAAIYLTEVWTSREAHTEATQSEDVRAWAEGMPALVALPPSTPEFAPAAWNLPIPLDA